MRSFFILLGNDAMKKQKYLAAKAAIEALMPEAHGSELFQLELTLEFLRAASHMAGNHTPGLRQTDFQTGIQIARAAAERVAGH
jgi:hypothetical protein